MGETISREEVLDRLLSRASYLPGYTRVLQTRRDERQFIFSDGRRFFDGWFSAEPRIVNEIQWFSAEQFRVHAGNLIDDEVPASFLCPYADIPQEVLATAPRRADRAEAIEAMMEERPSFLSLVRPGLPENPRWLLHHAPPLGWLSLTVDPARGLQGMRPWDAGRARQEIEETLRHAPGASPEAADAEVLAAVLRVRVATSDVLARLAAGEAWQLDGPPLQQLCVRVGPAYFHVYHHRRRVTDVSGRSEARIVEWIFERIASGGRIDLIGLSPARWKAIRSRTDPGSYLRLMREGKLTVGGGPTTDTQWDLSFSNGEFVRRSSDGYEVREEPVSEEDALRILGGNGYGWVHFPEPPGH